MAKFQRFDAELAGLETLFGEATFELRRTCALPVAARYAADRGQAGMEFPAAAAFVRHLIDRFARLILRLDTATDAIGSDVGALTDLAESRAAGRPSSRRGRKARAHLEETAPRTRLAHLLAMSDRLMELHRDAMELFDDCYRMAESEAERLTARAVKLLTAVTETERQAAALDAAIANLERRFAPETASEAAVDLARDHAERSSRRAALMAKEANLREEQHALAESSAPLREFLGALAEGRKNLRALGDKLFPDTERRVILCDTADALLSEGFGLDGGGIEAPPPSEVAAPPSAVESLFDLRRKRVLGMPAVMQRKGEADAVFEHLFADLVGEGLPGAGAQAGKRPSKSS